MRSIYFAVLTATLLLCGCAASVPYSPHAIGADEARAVIEQVMLEQPPRYRPSAIEFNDKYMVLMFGTITQASGAITPSLNGVVSSGSAITTDAKRRLYFDSIAATRISHKRDWYVLDLCDSSGRILARTYTVDEGKARRFVDGVAALKAHR